MDTALVNGEYVPKSTASVSIFDRGFLFADSVYEVVPVYAGRAFKLAAHIQRLEASLDAIGIPNPHDRDEWQRLIRALIEVNGGGDVSVYLQVTRGAPARREHRLPTGVQPNVVAFCQSRNAPSAAALTRGVSAITQRDTRWPLCHIKSTSLLANVLATAEAHQNDASETLFIDTAGGVVEGASSNVFAVVEGRVLTPVLRETILPGITRTVVLTILRQLGIAHAQVDHLPLLALRKAQEVWICSSTREVLPVTQLDGAFVGDGAPGAIWARVHQELQSNDHE